MRADSEKTLAKYIRCNKYCCHAMTSSTFYWHHFVHQKYPRGQFLPPKNALSISVMALLYTTSSKKFGKKCDLKKTLPFPLKNSESEKKSYKKTLIFKKSFFMLLRPSQIIFYIFSNFLPAYSG